MYKSIFMMLYNILRLENVAICIRKKTWWFILSFESTSLSEWLSGISIFSYFTRVNISNTNTMNIVLLLPITVLFELQKGLLHSNGRRKYNLPTNLNLDTYFSRYRKRRVNEGGKFHKNHVYKCGNINETPI